jgi:hypothetical protein
MLKKIDTAMCDGIVMVLSGLSICCVYGKDKNNLFIRATSRPILTFNSVLRFVKDAHNKHLSIKFP